MHNGPTLFLFDNNSENTLLSSRANPPSEGGEEEEATLISIEKIGEETTLGNLSTSTERTPSVIRPLNFIYEGCIALAPVAIWPLHHNDLLCKESLLKEAP